MSTEPFPPIWPNSGPQRCLEHISHIFCRDAFLLLHSSNNSNDDTRLPMDLSTRLLALGAQLDRRPASREFVAQVHAHRKMEIEGKEFYNKYMRNAVRVLELVSRLENLRRWEGDMVGRLEGRLKQVRLVQRTEEEGVMTWVLEFEDEGVQEGLKSTGGRRSG